MEPLTKQIADSRERLARQSKIAKAEDASPRQQRDAEVDVSQMRRKIQRLETAVDQSRSLASQADALELELEETQFLNGCRTEARKHFAMAAMWLRKEVG